MGYKNQVGTYGQNMRQGESVRQTEAAALLSCAAKLAEGQKAGYNQLADAARHNQKLWIFFIAAVLEKDNPLPREIKNNILNLGAFVQKQTLKVIGSNDPSHADVLIRINRQIASGLSMKPTNPQQAAQNVPPALGTDSGLVVRTQA